MSELVHGKVCDLADATTGVVAGVGACAAGGVGSTAVSSPLVFSAVVVCEVR